MTKLTLGYWLSRGFDFYSGVPDSQLAPLLREMEGFSWIKSDAIWLPALREDQAVALAAGAYLGGRKPLVYMQNSGLPLDALASLVIPYNVKVHLLISVRHEPEQHHVMGRITVPILRDLLGYEDYTLVEEGGG
jgi:sulfopyruvate decarboxylase TPP-binding subunit